MNCELLSTFYVKANGEVLCNDDAGEAVSLGQLASDGENVLDVIDGAQIAHVRGSLTDGTVPWPGICEKCAFLRPTEPFQRDTLSRRTINKIQIEASLACGLVCPFCSNADQMKRRAPPYHFSPEAMLGMLRRLRQSDFSIGHIEYCGQGEPLSNPRFPDLVRTGREVYPGTKQTLITNGNYEFGKRVKDAVLDEIVVSIDGAEQQSYERYRIHGRVDRTLRFMRDCVNSCQATKVVWKYILFETNDSDEELIRAQQLAVEIGVTHILFVFSHSANRSKRYTLARPFELPLVTPLAVVNAHPSFYKYERKICHPHFPFRIDGQESTIAHIDDATSLGNNHLYFMGWCLAHQPIRSIELVINGIPAGRAGVVVPRPDVLKAYPSYSEQKAGFRLSCTVPQIAKSSRLQFGLRVKGQESELGEFLLDMSTAVAPAAELRA